MYAKPLNEATAKAFFMLYQEGKPVYDALPAAEKKGVVSWSHCQEGVGRVWGGGEGVGGRELFLFRVLAALDVVKTFRILLLPRSDHQKQCLRFDGRLGHVAAKWERSLASKNGGQWAEVYSRYRTWQLGFSELAGQTASLTPAAVASLPPPKSRMSLGRATKNVS